MIATIGFFDGVHEGHRYVLSQVKSLAEKRGEKSVVITFRNHPSSLFCPSSQKYLLLSPENKVEKIRECGIDDVVLLEFDKDLASKSAEQFLEILKNQFDVSTLLLGYDNHFGRIDKDEDGKSIKLGFSDYESLGERVGVVILRLKPFPHSINQTPTSSSLIRSLLIEGNLDEANERLGYDYTISGVVIDGFKVGRKLGFPTANIHIDNQQYPKKGVYAAFCKSKMHNEEWMAVVNIGNRPTFNREETNVEVHIINQKVDIYGDTISVKLRKRLRDEVKFSSQEELISQIKVDVESAVNLLKGDVG